MTNNGYISKYGSGDIPLTVSDLLMYRLVEYNIKIVKNGEVIAEGTQGMYGVSPSITKFNNRCVKKISHKYSGAYIEIGDDIQPENL